MKKSVAISALAILLTSISVYGQGQIGFSNNNTELVTLAADAASAWGVATGAPVPKGSAAAGDPFRVSLYFSPGGGAQPAELTQVAHTVNFSRFVAGTWVGGNVTLTGVAQGAPVWLQVKAWEASYGATYETAIANFQNGRGAIAGASTIWTQNTAAAGQPVPGIMPPTGGFDAFALTVVVPEPSTIALGLLGLAGLFIFRRRQ